MRVCPFCNSASAAEAPTCPSCGRRLPPAVAMRRETSAMGSVPSARGPVSRPMKRAGSRQTAKLTAPPPPDDAELAVLVAEGLVPSPLPRAVDARDDRSTKPAPRAVDARDDRSTKPAPTAPTTVGAKSSVARASTLLADVPDGDGIPTSGSPVPPTRRHSAPPPTPRPPVFEPSAPPPTRPILTGSGQIIPPPPVGPMPEIPEAGIVAQVRYTVAFSRSRWQRTRAIRFHHERIREDTGALDGVLYELGTAVHTLGIDNRATAAEVRAIEAAEDRRASLGGETVDLQKRLVEEDVRFTELEAEREGKVAEAQRVLELAEEELETIEAQRRALRDKRKAIERQLKGYLKAADDREADAGRLPMGDERTALRTTAEDHRREAASLDPERQELERKLAASDRPHSQTSAKVETLKAELEAARRGLQDAREGHRHRLSELDAEQGRKGKELSQASSEIHQRLVTLGTIVNLNRVERPELDTLYNRIDRLRDNINERSRQIDRLTADRESYDRGALLRGTATLVVAVIALLTVVIVVIAAM
jgi:hypothetical protein